MTRVKRTGALWISLALSVNLTCKQVNPAPSVSESSEESRPILLAVGGGPDKIHNQVAIESNVRYMLDLFPDRAARTALFADGDRQSPTVLYQDPGPAKSDQETALELLLARRGQVRPAVHFREPHLPQLDGPASRAAVSAAFEKLSHPAPHRPIVLYFGGHGSQANDGDPRGNIYLLWHDEINVPTLAREIARLPTGVPVVLVMAQCYSGAFASALFSGASSRGAVIPQDIAGFFGATADRVSAGCTPEVREAEYQDFTTYFMAALSGRDRLGRTVTGADYNRDGQVGMDEAFCYALVHDPTVDVPVCTSDEYVRDRVPADEWALFSTSLDTIRPWATPAQRAALDALAAENSGLVALYREAVEKKDENRDTPASRELAAGWERFQKLRARLHRSILESWPALSRPGSADYARSHREAVEDLAAEHRDSAAELIGAYHELDRLRSVWEQEDVVLARRLRLLRLVKTIVLTHRIMTGSSPADRRDLQRLLASEQRPLFPHTAAR